MAKEENVVHVMAFGCFDIGLSFLFSLFLPHSASHSSFPFPIPPSTLPLPPIPSSPLVMGLDVVLKRVLKTTHPWHAGKLAWKQRFELCSTL